MTAPPKRPRSVDLRYGLTYTELEVLARAARGLSIEETAADMFLSWHTVKTHRGKLVRQMGARNIVHAVALAYQHGLFNLIRGVRP